MDALADQYERNAKVALVLAKTSADMTIRRDWLNVAGEWVALAKARRDSIVISRELLEPQRHFRRPTA